MHTDVQGIPTPLLKPFTPRYVLETGQQITETYLKIITEQLRATGLGILLNTDQF